MSLLKSRSSLGMFSLVRLVKFSPRQSRSLPLIVSFPGSTRRERECSADTKQGRVSRGGVRVEGALVALAAVEADGADGVV